MGWVNNAEKDRKRCGEGVESEKETGGKKCV